MHVLTLFPALVPRGWHWGMRELLEDRSIEMSMDRVSRILQIIVYLQGRQPLTSSELMARLQISRRTLFRDLKMLEMAGIPYYHEAGQGYRLGKGFYLPPVSLTVPETLGLMLLAKTTQARKHAPLVQAAVSAITKLTATVPDEIRQTCTDMLSRVSVDHGAQLDQPLEAEHYLTLQRCIDEGRCCKIIYKSPADPEVQEMRLDAYALHFSAKVWYVMGYCDVFDEVRILKLSRIQRLSLMQRLFVKPRKFSPMDKIGKAWHLIPEGRIYQVELLFSARVATNVIETRWHASQQHELLADGRCKMTFEVDGIGEIAWWICGYADQVEVIGPTALRRRVKQMLAQALAAYDKEAGMGQPDQEVTMPKVVNVVKK